MGTVLTIAVKDLRLMSRDWLGMFFIIGFPLVMAVLFGSMYGGFDRESVLLGVAVVDEDQSDVSREFVDNLKETGNVDLQLHSRQDAVDRVRRGELVGLIALPRGFGETAGIPWMEGPAIEVGIDPSRKAETGMLEGLVMQAVGELMTTRFQDPSVMRPLVRQAQLEIAEAEDVPALLKPVLNDLFKSLDRFMESWQRVEAAEREAESTAEADASGDSNADAKRGEFQLARIEAFDVTREIPKDSVEALVRKMQSRWDISFPQAMLWGVLACAAGFAITFVRERKQGTLLRLQVAPVSRGQILAGKATACFLTVVTVILALTLLGVWLGMRPQNLPMLAVAAVCVAFCFVGIMMLMSVVGKSEEAVAGASWMANMFMAMFGGGMVPLAFMPSFMKTLSDFSPAKWSVLALEGAIWRGFSWAEMLAPCGILLGVGSIALAIGTLTLSRATN